MTQQLYSFSWYPMHSTSSLAQIGPLGKMWSLVQAAFFSTVVVIMFAISLVSELGYSLPYAVVDLGILVWYSCAHSARKKK